MSQVCLLNQLKRSGCYLGSEKTLRLLQVVSVQRLYSTTNQLSCSFLRFTCRRMVTRQPTKSSSRFHFPRKLKRCSWTTQHTPETWSPLMSSYQKKVILNQRASKAILRPTKLKLSLSRVQVRQKGKLLGSGLSSTQPAQRCFFYSTLHTEQAFTRLS